MINVEVLREDVISVPADVLLLKHAQQFYGADESVFLRLHRHGACQSGDVHPDDGQAVLIPSQGSIQARNVLFLGAPRLTDFRYREIRIFAQRAIEFLAKNGMAIETIATTTHGAGYGLDVVESFRSMILGFQQGLTSHPIASLKRIVFVERNVRRFELLDGVLGDVQLVLPPSVSEGPHIASPTVPQYTGPAKQLVFVAMPFSQSFEDVYQFGIYQTVRRCGYICEKVDESVYAGSIVDRIMTGIQAAKFVIADLTEERPNVYLEVGYAWGRNKPVLLVAREGQKLHFDLSHHKCLFYSTIGRLADQLERTIRDMFPESTSQ